MRSPGPGPLLREWRDRRRFSQMDLALRAGVSTRHLSFVETGRAQPSAELLLALGRELSLPLREQNTLLLAAGFAPRFSETPLEHPRMQRAMAAVQKVLDAHDPYPAVLLDRLWNVVAANRGALALVGQVPAHLLGPPLNVFRVSLHPDGLAPRTHDRERWARHLLAELDRVIALSADPAAVTLSEEVRAYPGVVDLPPAEPPEEPEVVLEFAVETTGGAVLRFFTTLTTFGSPLDVTLDELMIEHFYPGDDATAEALRAQADATG